MKALIFDLDNTLIMWKDKYTMELFNLLSKYKIENKDNLYKRVNECLDNFEKCHSKLTPIKLLEYINMTCNLQLPIKFIDELIIAQGNCYDKDELLVDTIKYLASKYDLYVITNWFTDTQKLRLKNIGILDYFQCVWGADINYLKPNPKCYDCILKDYRPEDCISIGDSFSNDIVLPDSLGIKPIWVSNESSNKYQTIKNVYELKEVL